jgi:2-polyprenyl-6-methoxyphenol hydroxylase-like FAD-dependent oxidoreductase
MMKVNRPDERRALIIGGSLGGLFAGNLLRQISWDVDIFERSAHDLDSRGGGIVLQPEVIEVFRRVGVDIRTVDLGVRSEYRTVFRPDGSIQSKHFAPQTQTSWSLVYTTLKAAFGDRNYHQAKTLVRINQDPEAGTVTAQFEDGTCETGDLLIGSDGGDSGVRQQFWPTMRPTYAGYLAWRGLLPEDAMPLAAREMLHGDFGFANNKGSHILGYLVPGEHNDVHPGHRLYNWVWYRVANERMLGEIMIDRNGHRAAMRSPKVCWQTGGLNISIATQRACFPFRFARSWRRQHSPSPKPSATSLRIIWPPGASLLSVTPPRFRDPIPRRAPQRRPLTHLDWRTSCRLPPKTFLPLSHAGGRHKSHWASTFASRDLRQAITYFLTDHRLRKLGDYR